MVTQQQYKEQLSVVQNQQGETAKGVGLHRSNMGSLHNSTLSMSDKADDVYTEKLREKFMQLIFFCRGMSSSSSL